MVEVPEEAGTGIAVRQPGDPGADAAAYVANQTGMRAMVRAALRVRVMPAEVRTIKWVRHLVITTVFAPVAAAVPAERGRGASAGQLLRIVSMESVALVFPVSFRGLRNGMAAAAVAALREAQRALPAVQVAEEPEAWGRMASVVTASPEQAVAAVAAAATVRRVRKVAMAEAES